MQEDITPFDVFGTVGLVKVQFLPLVIAREESRRKVISLRIKIVRGGKVAGLYGQSIIVGKFGQRFGRKGQRLNYAGQFAAQFNATVSNAGRSTALNVTDHQ